MRGRVVILLWMLGIAALTCGCARRPPRTTRGAERVPGIDLRAGDRIESLDLAVEGDSVAVIVWTESAAPGRNSWIQFRNLRTGKWRERQALPASAWHAPRLGVYAGRIHIFEQTTLRHAVSTDDGRTWEELPNVLAPGEYAREFDVVPAGRGIALAYSQRRGSHERYQPDSLGIWAVRWRETATAPALLDIVATRSETVEPRLLARGDSVDLFYVVREEAVTDSIAPGGRRVIISHGTRTAFKNVESVDGGATWSAAHELVIPPSPDGRVVAYVEDFEPVRLAGRTAIFYCVGFGPPYLLVGSPAGDYSKPVEVCVASRNPFGPEPDVRSLAAAAGTGGGQFFWVDRRFSRTDRWILNPLAGFPDATGEWPNNDVLVAPIGDVTASRERAGRARLSRLSSGSSYAEYIRAASGEHAMCVLWSGYDRVGRDLRGHPPRLYFAAMRAH